MISIVICETFQQNGTSSTGNHTFSFIAHHNVGEKTLPVIPHINTKNVNGVFSFFYVCQCYRLKISNNSG